MATPEARYPEGRRARIKATIGEVTRPFYGRAAQTQARHAEARATEATSQTVSKTAVPPPTRATISRSSARPEARGTTPTRLSRTVSTIPTVVTARPQTRRERPRAALPQEVVISDLDSKT